MGRTVMTCLLVLGLSSIACSKQSSESGRSTASASPSPSASAAEQAIRSVERGPVWEPGKHYRYQLKTSSQVWLNKTSLYDFDLTGTLQVVLTRHEDSTDTLFLALNGAQLKSRVPGSQPEFDKLLGTLKSPFFVELKTGLISASYLPKDLHPLAASVFRALAASVQVAPGLEDGKATFTAQEYDTTGQYQAEYVPTADGSGWSKRKQRYLGILLADNHPKEAERVIPRVEKSEGLIRVGPSRILTSVEQLDELSFSDAQTPMRSRVQLSLSLLGNQEPTGPDPLWADLLGATTRLEARLPYQSELGEANLDTAKIRGLSFDVILKQFETLAVKPKSNTAPSSDSSAAPDAQAQEQNRLFVALGAVLRTQPQSVDRAVSSVRAKSAASDTLIDALGNAGSPSAQAALVKFTRGKDYPDTLRNRAAISLSRTEHPEVESVNALLSLVDDEIVGTQALYGLGSYCKVYIDSGRNEQASKLGEFLIKRLVAARSELRVIEALRAIANSAYLPALKSIKPLLLDPRKQVRVDAVRSLQLMPSKLVDELLVERLASDTERSVKLAAIEAIDDRAPTDTLVTALRSSATADDPHVRYRSVETMIRWLPKRTELRETIQAVAKNEQEPKIRSLAEAAL